MVVREGEFILTHYNSKIMKKRLVPFIAAGALIWGLGACSSTSTETTTDATAETVTTNDPQSATRAGETGVANDINSNAADAEAAATATDTASFPMMAASSDLFETLSSQMAQTKGSHAEVKNFAQHMLSEHGKTTAELKSLASRKNITLPTSLLPMHQRMLTPLNEATDAKKFDERYMDAQVTAHQQAVSLFEKASKSEADPELKAFAAKTLPALRMHLDMAKKTKDLVD